MEDEAAKRRERLKAMRKEAEQSVQLDNPASSLPSGSLSNPFTDTSDTSSTVNNASHASRFDYYSDPLSAFSANKKRNIDQDQMKPSSRKLVRNRKAICTCEAPMLGPCLRCKAEEEKEEERGQMLSSSSRPDQLQVQYPPGERPIGGNAPYDGRHYPQSSPMPIPYPPPSVSPRPCHFDWNSYGNYQGYGLNSFPHPISQNQMYPSPPNGSLSGPNAWNPSGNQQGFPLGLRSPNPVYPPGNGYPPIFDHGRGGRPIPVGGRHSYAPYFGRGSEGGFGRGNEGRPLFVGRGSMEHGYDRSRNLDFDYRGVKPGDNTLIQNVGYNDGVEHGFHTDSPGLKFGMDRKRKHTDHVDNLSGSSSGLNKKGFKSFDEKTKLFYLDSMVEDPWRHMNPIVREPSQTTVSCPDSEKGWLPNSIRSKSAKHEETIKIGSDLNFADCLADSLKEATGCM